MARFSIPSRGADRPGRHRPDSPGPVGTKAHAVIGELAAATRFRSTNLWDLVWDAACRQFPSSPDWRSARTGRLEVASCAGVYLRRFMPPSSWRLIGREVSLGPGGIVDLVWLTPEGIVVYDEIKTRGSVAAPRGDGPGLRQARRYAFHGHREYPTFGGVRFLFLAAPSRSLLVLGREVHLLSETDFHFEGLWRTDSLEDIAS